jgi:hypothetical protein
LSLIFLSVIFLSHLPLFPPENLRGTTRNQSLAVQGAAGLERFQVAETDDFLPFIFLSLIFLSQEFL